MQHNIRVTNTGINLNEMPEKLKKSFEEIINDEFLSALTELGDNNDVYSTIVFNNAPGEDSLTGPWFLCGLDPKKVYDPNVNIEQIVRDTQLDYKLQHLDVVAMKINTHLPLETYLNVDTSTELIDIAHKLNIERGKPTYDKIDKITLDSRKSINYAIKNSHDPISKNWYIYMLNNTYKNSHGKYEILGNSKKQRAQNTAKTLFKIINGQNKNELDINDVYESSDKICRLTISADKKEFIEKLSQKHNFKFASTKKEKTGDLSTIDIFYDKCFDDKIRYSIGKHECPEAFENTEQKMDKKGIDKAYFGLSVNEYIKFFYECKKMGISSQQFAMCEAQFCPKDTDYNFFEKQMRIAFDVKIGNEIVSAIVKAIGASPYVNNKKIGQNYNFNYLTEEALVEKKKMDANIFYNAIVNICEHFNVPCDIKYHGSSVNQKENGFYIFYGNNENLVMGPRVNTEDIINKERMNPTAYILDVNSVKFSPNQGPFAFSKVRNFCERLQLIREECNKNDMRIPNMIDKKVLYKLERILNINTDTILKPGNTALMDLKTPQECLQKNNEINSAIVQPNTLNKTSLENIALIYDVLSKKIIPAKYIEGFKRNMAIEHPDIPIYISEEEIVKFDLPNNIQTSHFDTDLSYYTIGFSTSYAEEISYELFKTMNPEYFKTTLTDLKQTSKQIGFIGLSEKNLYKIVNQLNALGYPANKIAVCKPFFDGETDVMCIAYDYDRDRDIKVASKGVALRARDTHWYDNDMINKNLEMFGAQLITDDKHTCIVKSIDFDTNSYSYQNNDTYENGEYVEIEYD